MLLHEFSVWWYISYTFTYVCDIKKKRNAKSALPDSAFIQAFNHPGLWGDWQ